MESVVTASIMIGALLGALFGGYWVDKIGRYRMFMADMLFFVVSAIGCALAPNLELLILFRFLMGIGIGLDFPVALAFIAEYTASRGKGRSVTLWQPMWYVAVGATFAILLPFYFLVPESSHGDLWRIAVGGLLIGLFIFFHAAGPGAQGMTLATLSYPTSLRGAGAGFAQAVLRVGSTMGLVFFPIMTDALGLTALAVLAVAPAIGLLATVLIRWEPIGADVDAEDFEDADSAPAPEEAAMAGAASR